MFAFHTTAEPPDCAHWFESYLYVSVSIVLGKIHTVVELNCNHEINWFKQLFTKTASIWNGGFHKIFDWKGVLFIGMSDISLVSLSSQPVKLSWTATFSSSPRNLCHYQAHVQDQCLQTSLDIQVHQMSKNNMAVIDTVKHSVTSLSVGPHSQVFKLLSSESIMSMEQQFLLWVKIHCERKPETSGAAMWLFVRWVNNCWNSADNI